MKWNDWLEEYVSTPYGDIARKTMLHMFVKEGLKPFVERHGYRWAKGVNEIQSALATGLYLNRARPHVASDWSGIPSYTEAALHEDADQFTMLFTWTTWEPFWANWGHWDDVSADTNYGRDRRMDIENFVWSQLDLANSAQTRVVDEFLEDENQDDGERRRRLDDAYLRESAESGEWGGYRR